MNDWRTLGKAMRDAQRAYEAATDWDDFEETEKAMQAAEAAFDKALSEPPAALAEIEGLVERLHELDWGKWPAAGEAAAALETLSARVGELERRYTERDEQLTAEFSVSSEARARAARMEAALREIEYLDRPQVRGQPRRKSIQEVALAALSTEAKAQGGEHE